MCFNKGDKGLLFCFFICLVLLFPSSSGFTAETNHKASATPGYVGSEGCKACHTDSFQAWKSSHHHFAMQHPGSQTVLGDFNDRTFVHFKVQTRFFKQGDRFFIHTPGADGKHQVFEVKYVIGIEPLQQYILELPDGRLQAFSIVWDTQKKRWIHLNPEENIKHKDVLHWTRSANNFNAMCATCHVTHYEKNYQDETFSYQSHWAEFRVGCEACHGPGEGHLDWANSQKHTQAEAKHVGFSFNQSKLANQRQIEICAPCHSRRSQINHAFQPGNKFGDHYHLMGLDEDLYFSDGQIKDEVYVTGSFMQSKMYQAGVTCNHCHDPHSLKLKAPGNEVCTQCHSAGGHPNFPTLKRKNYNSSSHHFHKVQSEASLCVNCHAPERTYMAVDPRRDHSFRIPRPNLSVKYETPNACNLCHTDQSFEWAAKAIVGWYGDKNTEDNFHTKIFYQAYHSSEKVQKELIKILNDSNNSAFTRASTLGFLNGSSAGGLDAIIQATHDSNYLIRAYGAAQLQNLATDKIIDRLFNLFDDPIRAVRLAAIRSAATITPDLLSEKQLVTRLQAYPSLENAYHGTQDLPQALVSQAVFYESIGELSKAQLAYEKAIKIEPGIISARANLANLLNHLGQEQGAAGLLQQGIVHHPNYGEFHYALGLLHAQMQQMKASVKSLRHAHQLMPNRYRVAYNLGLALQTTEGDVAAAPAFLAAHHADSSQYDPLYALVLLYMRNGKLQEATRFLEKLAELAPTSPVIGELRQSIKALFESAP